MFLSPPDTFHVYGDLYWKDTFWTISSLYYNLEVTTALSTSFPLSSTKNVLETFAHVGLIPN